MTTERSYTKAEVMGMTLAVIDMARELRPPRGTTGRQALDAYASMIERLAIRDFGAKDWVEFEAYVRKHAEATRK